MAAKRKPTRKKGPRKTATKRAARKPASRSPSRKKARKRRKPTAPYLKPLVGVSILAVLVLAAVFLADFLFEPAPPVRPAPAAKPDTGTAPKKPKVAKAAPAYEVFPPVEPAPSKPPQKMPKPTPSVKPPITPARPRVAIIIDDLGYDKKMAVKFISLDAALTFAVLPHSPFQKSIATLAHKNGKETMLHLPMEPMEYPTVNPGPGTLLSTMTPDELIGQLKENLAAVPHIKGVNNHMGSKFTTAADQVNQVFSILKQRGLFFIDSRTTGSTVCLPSAQRFQLPFAQRDVFIDHFQETDFIRKQLKELIRIARRNGQAVGIAHPHGITYRILKEMLPQIKNKVELVPASEIAATAG